MRSMTVAVLASLFFLGCAPYRASLGPGPTRVSLDVPFFADNTDQCGPSALASVLGFWGLPAEPAVLREEIYRAGLKGSLTIDLLLSARSRGFSATLPDGSLALVKEELDAGHPLIAFLNVGFKLYPIGHYLVITGYDDAKQHLIVHSGMKRGQLISYKKFEKQWEKTKRWTLVIVPPMA